MTRRRFIKGLLGTAISVVVGIGWLAKKAVPRRFVRALRIKEYPGSLRAMGDVSGQGKWSG